MASIRDPAKVLISRFELAYFALAGIACGAAPAYPSTWCLPGQMRATHEFAAPRKWYMARGVRKTAQKISSFSSQSPLAATLLSMARTTKYASKVINSEEKWLIHKG